MIDQCVCWALCVKVQRLVLKYCDMLFAISTICHSHYYFIPVAPNGVIDLIQHGLRWWLGCLRVLLVSVIFMAAYINKLMVARMLYGDFSAGVKRLFTGIGWRLLVRVVQSHMRILQISNFNMSGEIHITDAPVKFPSISIPAYIS